MLGVDSSGLDEMDRTILMSVIEHYGGGPVGIGTLAVVVGEEPTIEKFMNRFYPIRFRKGLRGKRGH